MSNPSVSIGLWLVFSIAALGPVQPATNVCPGCDALRELVIAHERAELDSLKRGDMKTFSNFLADDAVFVDAQGPAGKAQVVENTAQFRLKRYAMSGVQVVPVSADAGLVVYKIVESGASHGKTFTAEVQVSALWVRRGARWLCLFSQETAAK